MHYLEIKGIRKSYNGKAVVSDISLNINSGEVVGLLGPNGAGKTTTFYIILGLITPDSGEIYLDGKNLNNSPMYKRARLGIGYLPQEASVFRKLTVRDNITAILETTGLTTSEIKRRLDELLTEFGIRHIAESYGYALSGGERRRVEISRALATTPSFLLLDEPFAGIDPIAVIDIQKIIEHLKKTGIGVIISDHNVRETLAVCDNAYIINEGKVLESGTPETIVNSEKARKVYLGEEFKL